jgi:hypothetical protein
VVRLVAVLTSSSTMPVLSYTATASTVSVIRFPVDYPADDTLSADFLIQSGLAQQIRFHGKRIPWFVSDVTRKDWNWLLNTMRYGQLFPKASDQELESLRRLGERWKARFISFYRFCAWPELIDFRRNTSGRASGYTSSTRFGAPAIPSGSFTQRPLTSSSTSRAPT